MLGIPAAEDMQKANDEAARAAGAIQAEKRAASEAAAKQAELVREKALLIIHMAEA